MGGRRTGRQRTEDEFQIMAKDLEERVKELECLYAMADLVERPGISIEGILEELVSILPQAWSCPEKTCARISYEDKEYVSERFEETEWYQSADIKVADNKVGEVKVFCREHTCSQDEGPFLPEEGKLINAVAERLGRIIERRIASDELGRVRNMLKNILENSPFGVYVISPEGKIEYVNRAMLDISGDTREQFLGLDVVNLDTYREIGLASKIRDAMNGRSFFLGGIEYTSHFGGKTRIRNFTGLPVSTEEGDKVIMFVEDITERKKAEDELKQAYFQLKTTQKQMMQTAKMAAIGQLAGGIAHEVRNPLAVISQCATYIEKKKDITPEESRDKLEMIKKSVFRADRIIRGLLDFARPSSSEFKPCRVDVIMERALCEMSRDESLDKIDVKKEFDREVPLNMGDETQLEQVFSSMMWNAVQAMSGGGELKLRVREKRFADLDMSLRGDADSRFLENDRVVVCDVEDTGVGMGENDLEKVLDPFFTTKEPGEGTGLGMAVSNTIVKNHGGFIHIESKKGKGTKATVVLPLSIQEERYDKKDPDSR